MRQDSFPDRDLCRHAGAAFARREDAARAAAAEGLRAAIQTMVSFTFLQIIHKL